MNYGPVISEAFWLTRRNRFLRLFGLLIRYWTLRLEINASKMKGIRVLWR
jgi:hypothetical protein